MTWRAIGAVFSCALAVVLAGCGGSSHAATRDAVSATLAHGPTRTIRLKVVQAKNGATLALVPVYIEGKGPFTFALDTGASQSLVSRGIAKQLNLKTVGSHRVRGVACSTTSYTVRIGNWRAGKVTLPATTIDSTSLGMQGLQGLQGLLGSDILSEYGTVTVDYDKQVLVLRPKTRH